MANMNIFYLEADFAGFSSPFFAKTTQGRQRTRSDTKIIKHGFTQIPQVWSQEGTK
jgi:hypothetical protein